MEKSLSNLMIGIIAGLVSSGIIWFFILIVNAIIKPKIRELLYKGIDLEGEWHSACYYDTTKLADKEEYKEVKKKKKVKWKEINISIQQSAYNLKGDLTIKNINILDGTETMSFYKFEGFIKDNFLILNYLPKSSKCIGLGTLLLTLKEGGKALFGNLTGTFLGEMEIGDLHDIKLERK
ncbi:hypothetical protein INQ51_02870 [Maribellus sp. CM-23]|uniref:hypothetical protein n=1 Tax=Maribellus sp. CM-23 TaxID=2781026 RepID=UPI001F24919B|nr:hypothetical protein [Maribellus sp. CM-23]MCE4563243.1 hypothetical protein [Maribellus sp. CM-23]